MAITIGMKLTGAAEIVQRLEGLESVTREKILRKAITTAIKPIEQHAKALAPVSHDPKLVPGLLRRSIGSIIKTYKNSGLVVGIVGPRTGYRTQLGERSRGRSAGKAYYQDPANYAHLVEFGVSAHAYKTRAGSHPGHRAFPFMRPAWDTGQKAAAATIARIISQGLHAAASKTGAIT